MTEDLLRFKRNQKYVFFDFETCNLNLGSLDNKPWQLGFIIINNGEIVEKHDFWLHWDDLKMSPTAAKMTGWTESKYKKLAVDPKDPLDLFEKYLYDESYINVGHNILGFDVYIHGTYRRCLGMNPDYSYIDRSIDTVCLAKAIKNDIKLRIITQRILNFIDVSLTMTDITFSKISINGFFKITNAVMA